MIVCAAGLHLLLQLHEPLLIGCVQALLGASAGVTGSAAPRSLGLDRGRTPLGTILLVQLHHPQPIIDQ